MTGEAELTVSDLRRSVAGLSRVVVSRPLGVLNLGMSPQPFPPSAEGVTRATSAMVAAAAVTAPKVEGRAAAPVVRFVSASRTTQHAIAASSILTETLFCRMMAGIHGTIRTMPDTAAARHDTARCSATRKIAKAPAMMRASRGLLISAGATVVA